MYQIYYFKSFAFAIILNSWPCRLQDGSWEYLARLPGYQGTPPAVYGVVWNPFKSSDGSKGSEFASYGVKHLKTWIMNETGEWVGTAAQFGHKNVSALSCASVEMFGSVIPNPVAYLE